MSKKTGSPIRRRGGKGPEKDLKTFVTRLEAYNFFNTSKVKGKRDKDGDEIPIRYGYARLDAFGRIYNRVLEHVLNPEALRIVLASALKPGEADELLNTLKPVLSATERDHLIEKLAEKLGPYEWEKVRDTIFNSPNAPVSYPFIWDTPQHDYVQWNGIGANAGLGALGRNVGEVMGVFGTLDWAEKDGWTLSSAIGGQGWFSKKHISFESSVNAHNLEEIEDRIAILQSPLWQCPEQEKDKKQEIRCGVDAGLPPIDKVRATKGEKLFDLYCAKCHAQIDRTSESRRIVAHMDKLDAVKTDTTMADNSLDYAGFSGILRNKYLKTDVGSVLLNTKAPVAVTLTLATENVVATPDPDKWFFTLATDWLVDIVKSFFSNSIKPSVKTGNYTPDTTQGPFDSLRAYKARSLNGIWATAPYLHNGSVPTLYDLLLPAGPEKGDPPKKSDSKDTKYRPGKFLVGSRELDPEKVGFRYALGSSKGFEFDTSLPSNSNAGHEYGTRNDPNGLPALTDPERWDLVEYLKGL